MARRRHTPEQIAAALRKLGAGTPAVELCRKLGVHENTIYLWKKKYCSLGAPEICELRQRRDENVRLRRLVADLTLDKTSALGSPVVLRQAQDDRAAVISARAAARRTGIASFGSMAFALTNAPLMRSRS